MHPLWRLAIFNIIILPPKLGLKIYPRFIHRDFISISFHGVTDKELPHIKHLFPLLNPEKFENTLNYLIDNYKFMSYDELVAHLAEGKPLSRPAIHLSFDDGYAECFTTVRHILLKLKIPATFFVPTDFIDNRRLEYWNKISLCIDTLSRLDHSQRKIFYSKINISFKTSINSSATFNKWILNTNLDEGIITHTQKILEIDEQDYLINKQPYLTKDQIRILASEGFTIGAHSKSHKLLGNTDLDTLRNEIVQSCQIIRRITGIEQIPFAFPISSEGIKPSDLFAIRSLAPVVGLFFASNGLRNENDYIVNRIWGEYPPLKDLGSKTNIPYLLHYSYQQQAINNILSLFNRKRR